MQARAARRRARARDRPRTRSAPAAAADRRTWCRGTVSVCPPRRLSLDHRLLQEPTAGRARALARAERAGGPCPEVRPVGASDVAASRDALLRTPSGHTWIASIERGPDLTASQSWLHAATRCSERGARYVALSPCGRGHR